jgi:thymidylate kinase
MVSHIANQAAPWIVVTGLDGSGKSNLTEQLAQALGAHAFRLPYHEFVKTTLNRSGYGSQFGDVHTDRLIFAADARVTNYYIREWRGVERALVSQRGWMDNYIFGAVQGVSYLQTDALLCAAELERPTAIIYLVADPEIAFERIRQDPDRDKYETLEFMRVQHRETLRFYQAVADRLPVLAPFFGIPTVLINTSQKEGEAVFQEAIRFLEG